MSNSKVPDNPLGDAELRERIKYLKHLAIGDITITTCLPDEQVDALVHLFTSEADKRVEAVLDRLEEQTVMMYFLYDDVTKHDVVPLSAIEAERQRLNKEGE